VTELLYCIKWRPSALEDLRKIIEYISQDNPRRAASFAKELHSKTQALVDFPMLGRQGRPGLSGFRELVLHPNYIVFYRILADVRVVQILRIKHVARRF